ncbi:DUF6094 domain-containing protein (plasmid) [Alkalihalophilus sp. As8PL]|uniref:DUF6094 domain-containing protein n=1 Tax=Alkalihalophilus sp. As8PL TaxID=3237103 RepID=A0AB39BMV0_9BACI
MARIASESKLGYYPWPLDELKLIENAMSVKGEGVLNMIDPCCGKGEALAHMQQHLKQQYQAVSTYGVELEKTRYEQANQVLDYCLNEGYENVRTENKYNLVLLNPPYDEVFHERTELRFLRALSSKSKNIFAPDSLLLFCVPQYVLGACANVLSSRFKDIKVYRFTDNHFDVFKQVVVFAHFGRPDKEERKKTSAYLRQIAKKEVDGSLVPLPTLEELDTENFTIKFDGAQPIELFRAGRLNAEELLRDLASSGLLQDVEKELTPLENRAVMGRPMLPLKPTHGGIAVASGPISGNLGNHIISGITKQVTEVKAIHDDEGRQTGEEYTKHFKSIVRSFTAEGVFDLE